MGSPIRRTRCISWAPSGWLVSGTTNAIDTDFLTLTCPDDFVAVRVGFTNINPDPYRVTKVIAAASATMNDFANPSGPEAIWTPLTFANRGVASDLIISNSGVATDIMVHGNRPYPYSGLSNLPRWTWSDWTPVRSIPRSDVPGAPRALMLRVLFPSGSIHTRPNGGFFEYHAQRAMNLGLDYVAGHVPTDAVTTPQHIHAEGACLGQSNAPVSCVQFLTVREGIVGMTTGDSHHQGTSTTTQFWNYLLQATVQLAAENVGRIPFGYWTTARGGVDSEWFFPALSQVLSVAKPSFVVLPGWTYNEMSGTIHANQAATDRFFARLMMSIETCQEAGAKAILLTPFPRDAGGMTPVQLEPWRDLHSAILGLREAGAVVVDAAGLIGANSQGQLDGTYLFDYTNDRAHPNDEGHGAVAKELKRTIQVLCGLNAHQAR